MGLTVHGIGSIEVYLGLVQRYDFTAVTDEAEIKDLVTCRFDNVVQQDGKYIIVETETVSSVRWQSRRVTKWRRYDMFLSASPEFDSLVRMVFIGGTSEKFSAL